MQGKEGTITFSGLWFPLIWITEVQLLHGDHLFETLPNPDRLQGSYLTEFFLFFQDKSATIVLLACNREHLFRMETIVTTRSCINPPVNHKHLIQVVAEEVPGKRCLDLTLRKVKKKKKKALQSSHNPPVQFIMHTGGQTCKCLLS